MVHVNKQSKLPYDLLRFDLISAAFAFFRDFFLSSGIAQKILCYFLCYFLKISGAGDSSVEDKMSGFSLHEGVRILCKSDLVFSLHRCWAYFTSINILYNIGTYTLSLSRFVEDNIYI